MNPSERETEKSDRKAEACPLSFAEIYLMRAELQNINSHLSDLTGFSVCRCDVSVGDMSSGFVCLSRKLARVLHVEPSVKPVTCAVDLLLAAFPRKFGILDSCLLNHVLTNAQIFQNIDTRGTLARGADRIVTGGYKLRSRCGSPV